MNLLFKTKEVWFPLGDGSAFCAQAVRFDNFPANCRLSTTPAFAQKVGVPGFRGSNVQEFEAGKQPALLFVRFDELFDFLPENDIWRFRDPIPLEHPGRYVPDACFVRRIVIFNHSISVLPLIERSLQFS